MVKHIVMWKLKSEYSDDEKKQIISDIKENLEGLVGKVPGLTSAKVVTDKLDTSTADVMLYCEMENPETVKAYKVHPEHQKVANTYVRPYFEVRLAMDYTV